MKRILSLMLLVASSSLAQQSNMEVVPSAKTQKAVVSILYPEPDENFPKIRWELTVDYTPAQGCDTRIIVLDKYDHYEVFQYQPSDKTKTLYEQMREHWGEAPHPSPNQLASLLKVEAVHIPIAGKQLTSVIDLYKALRVSPFLDTSLILDGFGYELHFQTASQDLRLSLDRSRENASPIMFWMDRLKKTVEPEGKKAPADAGARTNSN